MLYIPWSTWVIFITVELFVNLIGFCCNLRPYTVSPSSADTESPINPLVNVQVPAATEKAALYNLNFISCDCTEFQVLLFWDLNKTPRCGCLDTTLFEPLTSSSFIWAIQSL